MQKNIALVVIALLAIFLAFAFGVYYFSQKAVPQIPEDTKEEIIQEQKITPPKVIYNLSGLIQEIQTNAFLLEAVIHGVDEQGKQIEKKEVRKVVVTSQTKFTSLTFVESQPGKKSPKETEIAFRDFRTGDYVEAISNRDISRAEEFEAITVRLLPR